MLPIELTPPDLGPYRASNTGVGYVHRFSSKRPGPSVMIQALTHGNELCGAIALDWLFKQGVPTPPTGELVLSDAQWTLLGAPWLPVEDHEQRAALDLMEAEFDERSGAIKRVRALRDSMKRSTCHVDAPTGKQRVAAGGPDHDVAA